MADAALSSAHDEIKSDKYLKCHTTIEPSDIEDNNAVDWSQDSSDKISSTTKVSSQIPKEFKHLESSSKPKYRKPSYDERQLPPVAIEYKLCQKSVKKIGNNELKKAKENSTKNTKMKNANSHKFHNSHNAASGSLHLTRRGNAKNHHIADKHRNREEEEIYEYHQLISNKEQILNNSKYTKLSSWAQYLKDTMPDKELLSPSALGILIVTNLIDTKLINLIDTDLFDAYKIGVDADFETLQQHLQKAKEIEKKVCNCNIHNSCCCY